MNINNQKKFFQQIALDENGNIIIVVESKDNPINKGISQYNTFKKLKLTDEGYLTVYSD